MILKLIYTSLTAIHQDADSFKKQNKYIRSVWHIFAKTVIYLTRHSQTCLTSFKQASSFTGHYYVMPSLHFSNKITCIMQPPAFRGHHYYVPWLAAWDRSDCI